MTPSNKSNDEYLEKKLCSSPAMQAVEDYDMVVVGAGRSGTSAAIIAAQYGLKVAVLESKQFPRPRPGETLHPGLEIVFKRLGIWDKVKSSNAIRHPGVEIITNAKSVYHAYGNDSSGPWLGFQIDRAWLDQALLNRAIECGVSIFQPFSASFTLFSNSRIAGVSDSERILNARWIIDASGGRHWLARKMGLSIEKHSPRLIARFGYASGSCPARDLVPAFRLSSNGWTWTSRVSNQKYHWTKLSFDEGFPPETSLPEELAQLKSIGSPRAEDVTWRLISQCAGPGFFLTGDAGAVLDPSSSHGVLRAIMSGAMAGEQCAKIANGLINEADAYSLYDSWFRAWVLSELSELQAQYSKILESSDFPGLVYSPFIENGGR